MSASPRAPGHDRSSLPPNWATLREEVLARDGHRCASCHSISELNVHHVHPKYFGGSHEPSNLTTLCTTCHAHRHIDLQIRLGARVIIRMGLALRRILALFDTRRVPVSDYSPLVQLLTGHPMFRAGQREIVDAIMAGRDVLVIRPTGSGKSLCYQLPALLKEKQTLVLAPLIAYMRDQVQALHRRGIPATFLCSELSHEENTARLEMLKRGCFKIFYLAPEGLDPQKIKNSERIKERFAIPVSLLVVDEADLISEWGETFRPSFLRLAEVRQGFGNPQVVAFTATAPPQMREDIAQTLDMKDPQYFDQGSDRPNVVLATRTIEPREGAEFAAKLAIVKSLLSLRSKGSKVLVFVPTLETGKEVEKALKETGFDCAFYRGPQDKSEKSNIQDRFKGILSPPLDILVATSAFSRGVDVPDIRFVIHWTAPATLARYYQDVGRAGRDGKPALALLLRYPDDERQVWSMTEKSIVDTAQKQGTANVTQDRISKYQKEHHTVLDYVDRGEQAFACQRRFLMRYFGYRHRRHPWLMRTALRITKKVQIPPFCCTSCDWMFLRKRLERAVVYVDKN